MLFNLRPHAPLGHFSNGLNFVRFAYCRQTGGNSERRCQRPAHARDAGRAGGAPPGFGRERLGALEREREEAKQALRNQAERGVALERAVRALAAVGETSVGLELVEGVLDPAVAAQAALAE